MSSMPFRFGSNTGAERAPVERAIAEMRMGRPVLMTGAGDPTIVAGIEDLDDAKARELGGLAVATGRSARLVLPTARVLRLGARPGPGNGAVTLPRVDRDRVAALAFGLDARLDGPVESASASDEDALELARLALALPAVIVLDVGPEVEIDPGVLRVAADEVRAYRDDRVRDLRIVGRAPVPLDDAPETEFVVFRGGEGLRDQIAVVVGHPDASRPVTVRMHSACLTGDLFGSLKCDCGDQLRASVRVMAEVGGGVLLYLDQEGRGNGIANKIRAYKLQAEGYDTYAADEMLGFGPDQRRFDFAAAMLTQLGIGTVRLLTNNPDKIEALTRAGIVVASHGRVFGRTTAENRDYLATKRDRAGHLIELEGAAGAGE